MKIAFYGYAPQIVVTLLPLCQECQRRGHEVSFFACTRKRTLFYEGPNSFFSKNVVSLARLTEDVKTYVSKELQVRAGTTELENPYFPDSYNYACINYEGIYLDAMLKNAHAKGGKVVWTMHGISQIKGSRCECVKADIILANAPDTWWTCFKWEHPGHTHSNPPAHNGVKVVGYLTSDYLFDLRDKLFNKESPTILYAPTHKFHSSDVKNALRNISLLKEKYPSWRFITKGHGAEPYNIYPLLASADILISDASSTIWEFLVLNRPIVLLNEFAILELKESQPNVGFRVSADKIEKSIIQYLGNPGLYKEERTAECRKVHYKFDGNAARRAVDALEQELES